MPFTVALTGGIGSGKSAVARAFAALGAPVVDTDEIAHALTGPGAAGSRAIAEAFGPAFLTPDGALDRKRMRDHVYTDRAAKILLERLLHPMIRAEARARVAAAGASAPYVLLVVPLLVETGAYENAADRVLVVDCPEDLQVARVMQRNAMAEPEVRAIMATQAAREARLAQADDVLVNDGPLDTLAPRVAALHARYQVLAHAKNPR
jgi:dephospho-CoA kinase